MKIPEDRKQSLRKNGHCFICLRRGHISRECRTRTHCPNFSVRRHPSICSESTPVTQELTTTPSTDSTAAINHNAASFQPSAKTSLFVGADNTVLLQTAKVHIFNLSKPDKSMSIRAVLDTGSQKSYITQRARDTLELETHDQRSLSVITFGSTNGKTQTCDLVRASLSTKGGGHQELQLFAVPVICQPLAAQLIDLCATWYKHLSDLDLADHSADDSPMAVDLLIGLDFYWDLVTGEVRRGESGPAAIHTRFGWVLSGVTPLPRSPNTSHSFVTTHMLKINISQAPRRAWMTFYTRSGSLSHSALSPQRKQWVCAVKLLQGLLIQSQTSLERTPPSLARQL